MPHVPPLPMTCLTCILLLICLLWTLRFKRRQALLPPSAPPPPAPHKNKNKTNDNLSPKVQLLRSKLAIAMGNACPIRDDVKTQQPDALDEPWSGKMSGPPYRHVGKSALISALIGYNGRSLLLLLFRHLRARSYRIYPVCMRAQPLT